MPGSARPLSMAVMLAAVACHSSDGDARITCVDLADRRVAKPELWDSLLMRQEPPVRAVAAREAGQVRDVRLAGVVGRALDVEEKDDVRAEQLFALGQIADPASAAALLTRINANVPAVRAAAIEALGKLRIQNTVPTLVGHLLDPAPVVRGATLLALVRVAGRRNADRQPLDAESQSGLLRGATALLDDPDAGVRWMAAYALAEIDVAGRGPALRHAAEAAELETRFFGMSGLVRLAAARSTAAAADATSAADFLPKLKDPNPARRGARGERPRPRSATATRSRRSRRW